MKKLFTFMLLFIVIISCSKDDTTNENNDEQQEIQFPEDLTFVSQTSTVGEELIVNGKGFSSTETYTVTFAENTIGSINEINTNYLKVGIPLDAITGDVSLTYNNETKIIGRLTIESSPNPTIENVFIYHESQSKLAKVNLENGNLTYIADFSTSGTSIGAVYKPQSDEYIFFSNNTDPNYVIVNTTTGDVSYQVLNSTLLAGDGSDVFSAPVIDANGVVYIYHESQSKLATLDVATGNLTYISDFFNSGSTIGAIYNNQSNEYIFFSNNTDPNYIRVDTTSGNVYYEVLSSTLLVGDGTDIFSAPAIDTNGVVYIYHESQNKLATLDVATGNLTYVADFVNGGTTIGGGYYSENNEYVHFSNNTDPNYVKVDLSTNDPIYEVISSPLLNGNDTFSGLTIKK